MQCDVVLGRPFHMNGHMPTKVDIHRLVNEGYDSVVVHGRASGTEYVVFHPKSVRVVACHPRSAFPFW